MYIRQSSRLNHLLNLIVRRKRIALDAHHGKKRDESKRTFRHSIHERLEHLRISDLWRTHHEDAVDAIECRLERVEIFEVEPDPPYRRETSYQFIESTPGHDDLLPSCLQIFHHVLSHIPGRTGYQYRLSHA